MSRRFCSTITTAPMISKGRKTEPSGPHARPGQPFFGQIQLRGGKSIGLLKGRETDPVAVPVPAFYPDHEINPRGNRPALRLHLAHGSAGGLDFGAVGRRWLARQYDHFPVQRPRHAPAPAQAIHLRRRSQDPADDFFGPTTPGSYHPARCDQISPAASTSAPHRSRSPGSRCPITWRDKICSAGILSRGTT